MNFDLDDEQRDFARGAKEFYESSASAAAVRAQLDGGAPVAPGLKSLADIGFYGITVAESAGGSGRTVLDLAVVAEQGGRVLAGPSL
ncbi:MAG: acyl-CoA dehydrogenase family protein, partial [Mycobacteriales bacterium]